MAVEPARTGPQRSFLFLQGPPGPFFRALGDRLARDGVVVHRINLNGGDRHDWPGGSIDFREPAARWPGFFEEFVRNHGITDIILFGDCRKLHRLAIARARSLGVAVHVFEEGYVRPDWTTLEPGGVNGHSSLPRDPQAIRESARQCPRPPTHRPLPAGSQHYWRRQCARHYVHVVAGRMRFPHYRTHRHNPILADACRWACRALSRRVAGGRHAPFAPERARDDANRAFVLIPLQLSDDFQIRAHSPFATMEQALALVMADFAEHAPHDLHLLIKIHPLDVRRARWRREVGQACSQLGLSGRVTLIEGDNLQALARRARGLVTVNSTAAMEALRAGTPVKALGRAVYDIAGMTHQGPLSLFWTDPQPVDRALVDDFLTVLQARALVHGNFASPKGIAHLVRSSAARLLCPAPYRASDPAADGAAPPLRSGSESAVHATARGFTLAGRA